MLCFINTSFYRCSITKKIHFLLYAFSNELNLFTDNVRKKVLLLLIQSCLGDSICCGFYCNSVKAREPENRINCTICPVLHSLSLPFSLWKKYMNIFWSEGIFPLSNGILCLIWSAVKTILMIEFCWLIDCPKSR